MSIGKPLPHDAAPLHVTGQARYIDDVALPSGALHLAFGLSTVAHGEITGIDLAAVKAAPGVVAVYSAADLDPLPDCSPSAHDEPLLATGRVHYIGQPIFLVVAESHLAARKAARWNSGSCLAVENSNAMSITSRWVPNSPCMAGVRLRMTTAWACSNAISMRRASTPAPA